MTTFGVTANFSFAFFGDKGDVVAAVTGGDSIDNVTSLGSGQFQGSIQAECCGRGKIDSRFFDCMAEQNSVSVDNRYLGS